jgi:hypothetical protein
VHPRHPLRLAFVLVCAPLALVAAGCGSSHDSAGPSGAGDAALDVVSLDAGEDGGFVLDDASSGDSSWPTIDGGFVVGDGAVLAADRFVTKVVSFTPGPCAGFGEGAMPGVVMGPPLGGGPATGSLDVVSLGVGGEIVLSFEPNAIVDGPGADFIVFENPFFIAGNHAHLFAEPGEVSVSDDGVTWSTFPCTATQATPPYGQCAGWHPVYSNPTNGISPVDPTVAGGDAFDLADLGLTHARYVRIRDHSGETCPDAGPQPTSNGFDLDAISIVNAETP